MGYAIGLNNPEQKEIYFNCSIEKLERLYDFDSKIRNILSLAIEYIEIEFKTKFANYFSIKYGPEGYTDPNNFDNKVNSEGNDIHQSIIDDFKKEINRHKNEKFVKHHLEKYDGHFPFWVSTELMSLGSIVSLYRIMKVDDKKEFSNLYGFNYHHFDGWLLNIVEVRNICAHNNKMYNRIIKQKPHIFKNDNYDIGRINSNKLMPTFMIIKRIFNSDQRWLNTYEKLKKLIDDYKDVINLSFLGFTSDWTIFLD